LNAANFQDIVIEHNVFLIYHLYKRRYLNCALPGQPETSGQLNLNLAGAELVGGPVVVLHQLGGVGDRAAGGAGTTGGKPPVLFRPGIVQAGRKWYEIF